MVADPGVLDVTSDLSRRNGALLEPLSNLTESLPLRDSGLTSTQLIASLQAANLTGEAATARDLAVLAVQNAYDVSTGNEPYAAIALWIEAAEAIMRITTVSHANWRLANARLLEISQRAACGVDPPLASCNARAVR